MIIIGKLVSVFHFYNFEITWQMILKICLASQRNICIHCLPTIIFFERTMFPQKTLYIFQFHGHYKYSLVNIFQRSLYYVYRSFITVTSSSLQNDPKVIISWSMKLSSQWLFVIKSSKCSTHPEKNPII